VVDFRDWLEIVDMFVGSAKLVEKAGWDGVQIHSAHGYLLAEFLSPLVRSSSYSKEPSPDVKTNPMARPLPGVPAQIPNRLHLLYLILSRLQDETDKKFIKAVKINSSDFVQGGTNTSLIS
jgi:2,4-dienoyl-CoA reductase-like NADH-dependent reductase (Old Yellow Enzyme family)